MSATGAGAVQVGPPVSFNGSRSGIDFAQLVPGVIQHLTRLIVAKGQGTACRDQPVRPHQLAA